MFATLLCPRRKKGLALPDRTEGTRGYVEFDNPGLEEDEVVTPFPSTDPGPTRLTYGRDTLQLPSSLSDSTVI